MAITAVADPTHDLGFDPPSVQEEAMPPKRPGDVELEQNLSAAEKRPGSSTVR